MLVTIPKQDLARGVILKLHGRCNLNCNYCYMYEWADQSWRDKPAIMSRGLIEQIAKRVAEYLREHELPEMNIILHGGEPTLAGKEMVEYVVTTLRAAIPEDRRLRFIIQTNATLLDGEWLELFLRHDIEVSVSLDGNEAGNSHRRYRNGKGSYKEVHAALELFQEERYRKLLSTILCYIELDNNPEETYDLLASFCRNTDAKVDFLLPFGNWDQPPKGSFPLTNEARYADWLLRAYERWNATGGPVIRLLEQIMVIAGIWLQGKEFRLPGVEVIGPFTVGDIVIDTDGSYELLDGLKTIAVGEPSLGLNAFDHTLTRALVAMIQAYRARGIVTVAPECGECQMLEICGGGYYPHRYKAGGYVNPSVYCRDLYDITLSVTEMMFRLLAEPEPAANKT